MNVDFLSLQIANADIDQERRIVRGVFISEEPNNQDHIFDYASSKPYISRWSRKFAADTNGKSKGNVRAMHGLTKKGVELVGTVAEIAYNDKAKQIEGAVHVVDDECWRKVQEGVITGFSFGGDSVGTPWKDKIASAKHGRPMKRYTFAPRELTLCDRGRIPGTEFTSIENADIETQEPNMDPNETEIPTPPVVDPPATDPVVDLVVDAPAVVDGSKPIENSISTANTLGSIVEMLACIVKSVEAEEAEEGQGSAIPAELLAAVKGLVEPVKKYQSAQIDEIVSDPEMMENADFLVSDDDTFDDVSALADDDGADIVENAWVASTPSGSSTKMAHRASVAAASGDTGAHKKAASAHRAAYGAAKAAGRVKLADYHKATAKMHRKAAGMEKVDDEIENADIAPPTVTFDPSPLEALIKAQGEQIAALTQRIENADTKPARNRPYMAGQVVLRDPIENADVEKQVEAEVQRIASLPPEQRAQEVMKASIRSALVQ